MELACRQAVAVWTLTEALGWMEAYLLPLKEVEEAFGLQLEGRSVAGQDDSGQLLPSFDQTLPFPVGVEAEEE